MDSPPPLPLKRPPVYQGPSAPLYPPPNQPFRRPQRKKRRKLGRICCCCLCSTFLIFLILALAAIGIFFLWFNPKLPSFHLQSLRIDPFNVSIETDGTYLTATSTTRIEARNPNQLLQLHYTDTTAKVRVGDGEGTELGLGSEPKFVQGKKEVKSLKFETKARHVAVGDAVGVRLKGKWKSRELAVNIEARTSVGFGAGRWKIKTVGVRVLCGNVTLKRLDDDVMPKCTLNLFRWINIH